MNEETVIEYLQFSDAFQSRYEDEERKLPYHINVIDELHINENAHSRILCKLLCFVNAKGECELLESLLGYIKRNRHSSEFNHIEIKRPEITVEKSRIDLWVRDKDTKYAIIFENKIYNAIDQEEQLSRYIDKTIDDGFTPDNIFVIYLSQTGIEPHPQSWGKYKEEFSPRYLNLRFDKDILDWLHQDVFPNIREKDGFLKTAIYQYIDYLEGFFHKRNNTMNMNLDKFISDHFKLDMCENDKERARLLQTKMDELQMLIQQMENLKEKTRQKIFEEWKQITKDKYPELHPLEFGAYTDVTFDSIDGKKVNVLIDVEPNNGLYCLAQFDTNLPEVERKVENTKIMTLKDVLPQDNNNHDCVWKYFPKDDFDGVFKLFLEVVERCKNLVD